MGNLLRRRELILPGGSLPEWDYEWDYTDGLLSENGWKKVTGGTATESIAPGGVMLKSSGNSYVTLRNPELLNVPIGIMRVVITVPMYHWDFQNNRVCLSNGQYGIQIHNTNGQWRLMDNTDVLLCTAIYPFTLNTEYTIVLCLNNGIGSVQINGDLVADNVDVSKIFYSANTSIWSQNQNDGYCLVKSIKIRLNRLS